MLSSHPCHAEVQLKINDYMVRDMYDGGMGSIQFVQVDHEKRMFGALLAEAEYIDVDGVIANIGINADILCEVFEIDIWKVDFSALERYPQPHDLRNIRLVKPDYIH